MIRPVCSWCNRNPREMKSKRDAKSDGTRRYFKLCSTCRRRKRQGEASPTPMRKPASPDNYRYQEHKGETCELCGFVPKHPCQLDVDHIDGNGLNHARSNLQTLCANCHRLKTVVNRDHVTPRVSTNDLFH